MSSSGPNNLERYLIPLEEIKRATDNFSKERFIGSGGFGKVYKGQLFERWKNNTVAIKRLDQDSYQGEREFRNELDIISKFQHENIISFIGYCDEEKEMIIVVEYAVNGSLDHYLGDPKKMSCMTWAQRLQICFGAAKGLGYFHSGLGEHDKVIHRDLKSANILLNGNLEAKICDFGLSKVRPTNQHGTQVYTRVAGTPFYLDPTYNESGLLRKESDVYSFGVVLFEMLSGGLVYRIRGIGNDQHPLMNSVRRYQENEREKIIDPHLIDQISCRSFDTYIEIAYECIDYNYKERPAMETVINKIEEALTIQTSLRSICTLARRSKIQSLMRKLKSASPNDRQMAASGLRFHAFENKDGCVIIGQAGAIPLLIGLLTASDSRTQQYAVVALEHLRCWEENIGIIASSGAVPGILHVLRTGSSYARENAATILACIYEFDEYGVTIDAASAIPPLLLLLSGDSYRGQKDAATVLCHLCKDEGNTETTVRAGIVPNLIELLFKNSLLIEKALELLSILSSHPEGKLAINYEAVPLLAQVLGSGSLYKKEHAAAVMGSLNDLLQNGTYTEELKAKLLEMIEDYRRRQPGYAIC